MPTWVEGIDYQVLEGGKVKCLHCDKVLEGKAGLGPHLTSCPERKSAEGEGAVAPTTEGKAPVPEEAEVLQDILIKFGMKDKRAQGVTDLMGYAGWDNFNELKAYCQNCGMNPDRILLVLKAWSNHRGVVVPPEVFDELQRSQQYMYPFLRGEQLDRSPYVTKDDLEDFFKRTEKEQKSERATRELAEEREKRHKLEVELAVKNAVDDALSRVPRDPTGKSVYDLLDKGITMGDKRMGEAVEVLKTPRGGEFHPEVKRSTRQKMEKVEEIEKAIIRKEAILDAKDDMALAFSTVMDEKVETPETPKAPQVRASILQPEEDRHEEEEE